MGCVRREGLHARPEELRRGARVEPASSTLHVNALEIRLKPHDCLLALALSVSIPALAAPPDAAKPAASGVACPAASAAHRLGAASSKGRHVPDEADPCADSRGVARPVRPSASAPAQ